MAYRSLPAWMRCIIEVTAVALAYYVAARIGLFLAFENTNATSVWPPSGIAFAAILLLGYRVWPGVFFGAFFANLVVFLTNKSADFSTVFWASSFIGLGNTLEALTGALFIHRWIGMGTHLFFRAKDTFKFLVITLGMSLIAATIGPTYLCLYGLISWESYPVVWFTWWLGDAIGILMLTPFLLAWIRPFASYWPVQRFSEAILLYVLLYLSMQVGFGGLPFKGGMTYPPVMFIAVPYLVWAVFRFGERVTTGAIIVISCVAILETVQGYGPFVRPSINEALLLLQAYIGIITGTMLMMQAVVSERTKARQEINHLNECLEQRVTERTEQLQTATQKLLEEIAERKRIEEEANLFFTRSLDFLVVSDFNGFLKRANPSFINALGFKEGELKTFGLELVHPDDRDAARAQLNQLAAGEETIFFSCRILTKNGSYLWTEWNAVPIMEQKVLFAVGRDVTERRSTGEALLDERLKSERLKAEREQLKLFSMIVSHDLQSPLQKIMGYCSLLETTSRKFLDEKSREYLTKIKHTSIKMGQLIEALLRFSRVTTQEEPFKPVDLNQVMGEVISGLEFHVRQLGARIECKQLPTIHADPAQMHELLLNFLSNALKFHKKDEAPHVRVESRFLRDGWVEIKISDNGIGFSKEDQERLFKPFQRLHPSEEFEGHGMGLAICQRIVIRHGGKIFVKSEPEKGTEFIITLPLKEERWGKAA